VFSVLGWFDVWVGVGGGGLRVVCERERERERERKRELLVFKMRNKFNLVKRCINSCTNAHACVYKHAQTQHTHTHTHTQPFVVSVLASFVNSC
jgi:hypothetical protein